MGITVLTMPAMTCSQGRGFSIDFSAMTLMLQ
jgi:hypothetical protein